MFPRDWAILNAVRTPPPSIADVLQSMQTIQATCVDCDGLKWFNWLYLHMTQAVEAHVASGGFTDPKWLAELDVQFARLPPVSHVEDTVAAWSVSAAREAARQNLGRLWRLSPKPRACAQFHEYSQWTHHLGG